MLHFRKIWYTEFYFVYNELYRFTFICMYIQPSQVYIHHKSFYRPIFVHQNNNYINQISFAAVVYGIIQSAPVTALTLTSAYFYYLLSIFSRLSDSDKDIRQLAQYGAMDMIIKAPHKILPVLPKVILPFKRAFNTRDKKIIIAALKVLQLMVMVGKFDLL